MLDVGTLVHTEETQRLLVADPVAVDQSFDLRAGDRGELALVRVKRAEPRSVRPARKPAERIDQRLRLGIEALRTHRLLTFAEPAGEHQPQACVVLLAGFDPLFLGKILREHPAAAAIGAARVHGADGLRKRLDVVEILPRIGTQRIERQTALGPCLVEGVLEHRLLANLSVDCR